MSLEGDARLEALITGDTRIRIVAVPSRDPDQVSLAFLRDSSIPFSEAYGVPIDLAAGEAKSVARRQELEIKLSLSSLAQVAQADRVVGMLCGGRFELNSNAINIMREFLLRVREELALTGEVPRAEGKPVGESL